MARSNYQRDDGTRLSMREKSLVKRRINKEHNSNFRAGYIHIDEEHLHKAGIRGRKTYLFWGLIAGLVVAIITNAVLTLCILASLDIGREGMSTLEFTPHGVLLRFLADTELDVVVPYQNIITSLPDDHIELFASEQHPVTARINNNNNLTTAAISTSRDSLTMESNNGFTVIDPSTGHAIFSTDYDDFRFPTIISNLLTSKVETNRVCGAVNENLNLEGDSVTLSGKSSVSVDTKTLLVSANSELDLTAGSHLHLVSGSGIYLQQMNNLPVTPSPLSPPVETYKVCVCVPSGTLFLVPSRYHCGQANENKNPCL